ncbi:MAG: YbhN family protein [Saprospiraceae bacterium]
MQEHQKPAELAAQEVRRFKRSLHWSRVVLPVLLGLGVGGYLLYTRFDLELFRSIRWDGRALGWLALAFLLLLARHAFYALRIRTLSDNFFSWKKSAALIAIWEFSAALTPTSKGGPFVMLFVLSREGLGAGRTAAAIFYSMLSDAGFFVLMLPIFLSIYGRGVLFPQDASEAAVRLAGGTFYATYSLILCYWCLLAFFLFVKPAYAARAVQLMSEMRLLRRWAGGLRRLSDEFLLAARELRRRSPGWHLRVIGGTVGAWTCKFAMINAIILAVYPVVNADGGTQLFIYARLTAMFIIMTFSPTPGGAGLAEVALINFIADYVPEQFGVLVALIWRGMAYYGYLLLGAFVVPAWLARYARLPAQKEA